MGIKFIEPLIIKNIAKMIDTDEIVSYVIREIGKKDLEKKKVLIIGGSSFEKIDDVRVITNISSGKTAINLAKNAFFRGADVELWYGQGKEPAPNYIKKIGFESISNLEKILEKRILKQFDIIIICAALSDYIPKKQKGKISSYKEKIVLEMFPAPKIVSRLRKKAPRSKIIGFKVEESIKEIKEKAMNLLKKNDLDFVVANLISGFNVDENKIWILDKKGKFIHKKGKKDELADYILDMVK